MKTAIAKLMVAILLCGIITSCTKGDREELTIPLPDGTERADGLCPDVSGSTCYKIPMPHNQTVHWFIEMAETEQWNLFPTTDFSPFSIELSKNGVSLRVNFYEQPDDLYTGVLIGEVNILQISTPVPFFPI